MEMFEQCSSHFGSLARIFSGSKPHEATRESKCFNGEVMVHPVIASESEAIQWLGVEFEGQACANATPAKRTTNWIASLRSQ
jgi:hypothetical protein